MVINSVQDSDDPSYQKRLIIRLRKVQRRFPTKLLSLSEYIQESLGAFPTDVGQALDKALIPYYTNTVSDTLSHSARRQSSGSTTFLADEHPNDFDWRFTFDTINDLVKCVEHSSAFNKRVALFGIKTLLPALIGHGAKTVLYERSPSLIQDFHQNGYSDSVIQHDLLTPLYNGRSTHELVIADPPWYLDFYEAYLDRGAELLITGGEFWLSVLPALTRPSALRDRRAIGLFATQRGFQLIKKIPGLLTYKTPAFERQSLAANGVNLDDWRLGDLWVFRKMTDTLIAPQHPILLDQVAWIEYRIGNKKLQVRKVFDNGYFDYWPTHTEGKFFHSVSRRATERDRITIWTSDNIAFTAYSVQKLIPFLHSLQSGYSLSETSKLIFSTQTLSLAEKHKIVALLVELELFT